MKPLAVPDPKTTAEGFSTQQLEPGLETQGLPSHHIFREAAKATTRSGGWGCPPDHERWEAVLARAGVGPCGLCSPATAICKAETLTLALGPAGIICSGAEMGKGTSYSMAIVVVSSLAYAEGQ